MDCKNAQLLFSEAEHGRLAPDAMAERQVHLETCAACSRAEQLDRELTRTLERRLPQFPASLALKRGLEARWLPRGDLAQSRLAWHVAFAPALVVAGILGALALGFHLGKRVDGGNAMFATEAVNNHLRLLDGETPLQVLASDIHQVKPWFAGKVDFAPPVQFKGDDDYPLLGGEVSRFLEQRVAHFAFARRLHKISLFVLPARGGQRGLALGDSPALAGTSRGFSLVGWQHDEFAYLLVSDVNAADLVDLGRRIQAAR